MNKRVVIGGLIAPAIVLSGLGGYWLGTLRSNVEMLSGTAYAGQGWASVDVAGTFYGIQPGVPWEDADGTWHVTDELPGCLSRVGSSQEIKFGGLIADNPHGPGEAVAVWVVFP
jgi:hypothetical protein